jgi:hypothetical protein
VRLKERLAVVRRARAGDQEPVVAYGGADELDVPAELLAQACRTEYRAPDVSPRHSSRC